MLSSQLGTVINVSRTNGTVDALLRSGLAIYEVPYLGIPPWKGLEARFSEIASGSWICQGLQGDVGGLGPNLCTNGNFEVDVSGWDTKGLSEVRFDSGTESWTGSNATVAIDQDWKFHGTWMLGQPRASLKVTSTGAGPAQANSPQGASGFAVTPGNTLEVFARVANRQPQNYNPSGEVRPAFLSISFWDVSNALILSTTGDQVTTDQYAWRAIHMNRTVPANSVHASVSVTFSATLTGEVFYVDSVFYTVGTSATLTRDTGTFHDGVASMLVAYTSPATVFAQYPSPFSDLPSGIPVNPGDTYYVDFWSYVTAPTYSGVLWIYADGQSQMEFDGESKTPETDNIYAVTWVYNGVSWLVPDGVVAMHVIILTGSDNPGVAQTVYIDELQIRQAFVYAGASVTSINPPTFNSQVGGKQQSPAVLALHPASAAYPSVIANGYVFGRKPHCKIAKLSGTQSLPGGAATLIKLDYCVENEGCEFGVQVADGLHYIGIHRDGWYLVNSQIRLASYSGLNGPQEMGLELWRNWAISQLITTICEDKKSTAGAEASMGFNCSAVLRLHSREAVRAMFWNGHNLAVTMDAGFAERQWLSVTYLADI